LFFFYPSIVDGDLRKFWQASAAFGVAIAGYFGIVEWVGLYYPPMPPQLAQIAYTGSGPTQSALIPRMPWPMLFVVAAVVGWIGYQAIRRRGEGAGTLWAGLLWSGALVAQLLLAYHIAGLLYLAGAVVIARSAEPVTWWPLWVAFAAAVLCVWQAVLLHNAGIVAPRNLIGSMAGMPSLWTYVRVSEYSLVVTLLGAAGAAGAIWRIAQRRQVAPVWLMLALLGWLPLLLIGSFEWDPAPRYVLGSILPLLLAAVATLASCCSPRPHPLVALLAAAAMVNPVATANYLSGGYAIHPDHQGAARYMQSLTLRPNDIVIAEDVISQAYYLERLDYWLIGWHAAASFVQQVDGQLRDIYTARRIVGSRADLAALMDTPGRGDIYIIGSGENQEDGRRHMRGEELHAVLSSPSLPVVYVGRDGLTKIWKISPGSQPLK
jgi:hypothetical protein